MATNTYVEIDLKEAADLADYIGIRFDLTSAREFARIILDETGKERPNWSLSDPMMTAVIARYARSFTTGVRRRFDDALGVLSPDQRAKHEYFCTIRNKYIAHSVNSFEESQPVARYWVERVKEEGITSISCIHHRVVGLSTKELNDIIELTSVMLKHVDARIREEEVKVLEIVRRMPLDQVLSSIKKAIVPDISDPTKSRPR